MFDPRDLIAAASVDEATLKEVSARVDPDRVDRVVNEALDQADRIRRLRTQLETAIRYTNTCTDTTLTAKAREPEERCGTPPSACFPAAAPLDRGAAEWSVVYDLIECHLKSDVPSGVARALHDVLAIDRAWTAGLVVLASGFRSAVQSLAHHLDGHEAHRLRNASFRTKRASDTVQ